MPRVVRNYEHVDYSYLLNPEPEKVPTEPVTDDSPLPLTEPAVPQPPSFTKEELLRSRRASDMDNPRMRYAYASSESIFHDKSCPLVKHIPDEDFNISATLPKDRTFCPKCYRKAVIRYGIGNDFKHYGRYHQFFLKAHVSNHLLHQLYIEHCAQSHLERLDTLVVKLREDTWKIVRQEDGTVRLFHNNYIRLEDGSRYITKDFHEQLSEKTINATYAIHYITQYSWDDHLKMEKLAQEALLRDSETEDDSDTIAPLPSKACSFLTRMMSWIKQLFH